MRGHIMRGHRRKLKLAPDAAIQVRRSRLQKVVPTANVLAFRHLIAIRVSNGGEQ
jgi:hypothetical protein